MFVTSVRPSGGNLAGIYASRNASAFHKRERPEAGETLTLLALTAPTHLTFLVPLRLLLGARTRYCQPRAVPTLLCAVPTLPCPAPTLPCPAPTLPCPAPTFLRADF